MLISDIPEHGAIHYGDDLAVVDGPRSFSYRRLAARCRQLGNAVGALAGRGDRVAILSQNRAEFVEAYYGLPGHGLPVVFINYRLHPLEMRAILEDCGASVLIVEDQYREAAAEAVAGLAPAPVIVTIGQGHAGDLDYEELVAGASEAPPTLAPQPDDLAWIIYTSGTTGRPKGAMLTHRNLLAGVGNWMIDYGPGVRETYLMSFPLCHIAGSGVLGYHLRGNTLIMRRAFEPTEFLAEVERHGVTGTSMAPTMIGMLIRHPRFGDHDLSSLRTITYGGSPISATVLRQAMERLPNVRFVQAFGMTELAGSVLCLDHEAHLRALDGNEELLKAAGRPMTFCAVRVVDPEMRDVAPGETGEIVVRGDQVQAGYWANPGATAESLAGGWFHTGDLGRVDSDGFVYIVDRKKDMIVTGGENVYSREVEAVIATHPAVADVAVIGVPDERWGEAVCAVIVAREGQTVGEEEIIAHCRASLAGYKRPQRVAVVSELPTNASGKVLKRSLRESLG